MKKLLKGCCTKNALTFNNVIYEQIDSVSMGSCLGPVLANIIMTELETVIVDKLFEENLLNFYIRYMDDTLVLIKESGINTVLHKLNSFHPNLKFTVNKFDDGIVHYLDIRIIDNQTDIYYKNTHSGQCVNFSTFAPWRIKAAWIKALFHRAVKICSNEVLLNQQIKKISLFMSWNGFPNYISKALLKRLKSNSQKSSDNTSMNDVKNKNEKVTEIFFRLPYAGIKGEQLVKHCLKKIKRSLKIDVKFVVIYDTKKFSFYCNVKDKVPQEQKNNIIYRIACPGCGEKYIGKTERCIISRMNEYGKWENEPMLKHLSECEMFKETGNLYALLSAYNEQDQNEISLTSQILSAVLQNHEILDVIKCFITTIQLLD